MKRWFEVVKPWSGEPASYERFVWLGCQGLPLNASDNTTFQRIGEIWGHFISVHDDTLRSLYFALGKILVATEEMSRIEKWIHLVVQGVKYDVLVKEMSSFVNPDEVEIPKLVTPLRPAAKFQEKVDNGAGVDTLFWTFQNSLFTVFDSPMMIKVENIPSCLMSLSSERPEPRPNPFQTLVEPSSQNQMASTKPCWSTLVMD